MGRRGAAALWLSAWCGPITLAVCAVVGLATGHELPTDHEHLENLYPNVVFGSLVPLLGALILTRWPRHPIGWLFLGCGLASALTVAVYGYATLAFDDHPGLPLGVAAAWVSEWEWTLGVMPMVTIVVLLFPDGRVPGPRWRYLLWLDIAAVVLMACAVAFVPGPLDNHPSVHNPLGIGLPDQVFSAAESVAFALFLAGFVGGGIATVVRWRRATGAQRAQLNWFALAVLLLVLAVVLPSTSTVLSVVIGLVAVPLLPMAVAVAILRRDLYGIEVLVRRSLVYAALTVVLLIAYTAAVAGLGALLQGRADTTVALVATAVVALAFAPLRDRLQHGADRLLFGDRGDPYALLTDVGRRLGDSSRIEAALAEVAETVASSLRLPYVRVELEGERGPLRADWGREVGHPHEVPLTYRNQPVGRLWVAPRSARDSFNATDLRLLDDLGRQIGVAAHAMLLGQALQQSREGLVTMREEERRRIRRDLHDGLGPALAGVALGLDAVHRLSEEQPAAAGELADQLKGEVHASLAEVRRLVEDLRPPALDQLGLLGALRQQATLLSERDPRLSVAVEATPLPNLPAAVEVAAYRIALEALNNVSRHANARSCRVDIGLDGEGTMRVCVEDDGCGLGEGPTAGVGLSSMRERASELGGTCAIGPGPRGGTCVLALIPVVAL